MKKLFVLLLIGYSASTMAQKVTADYDKNVDFSSYKTFKFLGWQKDGDKIMNDLDKQRLRDAFKEEFDRRNLLLVDSAADMAISLFLVVEEKTTTIASTTGRYSRVGWGTTTYSDQEYLEGTLVMDAYDEASGNLIWQGIATKTIAENPQKREKAIPKAIKKLMSKFPISPVSE